MMAYQFRAGNYDLLGIVHVPRGKYYTLQTDDELLAEDNQPRIGQQRLCCRLTAREFKLLTRTAQTSFNWSPP